jgi:hypothetical protein
VECHSGYTYAQEPRVVIWQGHRYPVTEVEQRWRTPDGPAFRVRTRARGRFDLHYREDSDCWTITSLPTYRSTNDQEDKEAQI